LLELAKKAPKFGAFLFGLLSLYFGAKICEN